jgi:hypothetical protein
MIAEGDTMTPHIHTRVPFNPEPFLPKTHQSEHISSVHGRPTTLLERVFRHEVSILSLSGVVTQFRHILISRARFEWPH